jgi:hypothetical protein
LRSPVNLPRVDHPAVLAPQRRTSAQESPAAVLAAQRAWAVLWLAFATFCIVLVSTAKFVGDYVRTAEIALTARVEASRGRVYFQAPAGPKALLTPADRDLGVGTAVEADRAGTAVVRLFDGSRVAVLPEARVELARMEVGRFINRQTLALRQPAGPVRYETNGEAEVQVPNGVVRLRRGDVTVWVEEQRTRVLVYDGEARLEAEGSSLPVQAGQRGELTGDRKLVLKGRPEQLLENGTFARRAEGWEAIDDQNGPRDVDGERHFVQGPVDEGAPLPALRIVRDSVNLAHGETGVRQPLDVIVAGYRKLFLEAWVRVDRASLSGGGQLGFEYPMMLVVQYEGPQEGSRPNWVHGFYTDNPEDRPVRNAEQVPAGKWVPYRVDLLDQEDEARRPYRLLELQVMGQGHSYDAQVADVRLIGD